ncbi:Uncharacterised protein [Segatella copri]|nr:Uncharacterised protein [Segatella copri]
MISIMQALVIAVMVALAWHVKIVGVLSGLYLELGVLAQRSLWNPSKTF